MITERERRPIGQVYPLTGLVGLPPVKANERQIEANTRWSLIVFGWAHW